MAFDRPIGGLTVFCEASNQPQDARIGVAASFFNRLRDGRFGKTVAAICLKRYQFSEWNDDQGDNSNLMRGAVAAETDPVLIQCLVAYDLAASGADPTSGATHYHDTSIDPPSWTEKATRTVQIGKLIFYANVP